ncbi:DUF6124 family protein [Pseudomonas sp. FEN]|uniref:DUF6124 family protein n=1 Tax=Pseudomonas sp. FEN TaxID=2767468 RepID=UPI00174B0E12|nr:hypothetical protein [Pseudomonas sp. FEN]
MFKITPNPPVDHLAPPAFQLAAERAFAHYALPPADSRSSPNRPHGWEETLVHIYEILQCASVNAYECADNLQGSNRKLALGAVHLIDMAQQHLDSLLDKEPARAD